MGRGCMFLMVRRVVHADHRSLNLEYKALEGRAERGERDESEKGMRRGRGSERKSKEEREHTGRSLPASQV